MIRRWAQRWRGPERLVPAIGALMVNAALGYALLIGLRGMPFVRDRADRSPLALFDLKPPAPVAPVKPPPPVEDRAAGGAPAALTARQPEPSRDKPRPAPITAPVPVIVVPAPALPVPAVPSAVSGDSGLERGSDGNDAGTGRGGIGRGDGRGDGGGGGDGGAFSRAKQTGGRFRNADFPESARGAGRLKIGVRYAIGPSGRIDRCTVIETSGYPDVDAMTCRIIIDRYRFKPARDPDGYAVTEVREEDYRWRVR